MAKPTKQHVAVRLAPEIVAQLDLLTPRLSTQWRDATRSDVLRALLLMALATVEANPETLR